MEWIGQQVYDFVATFRSGIIIDDINITTIQSSSESFADNDTSLMTSAAIDDRIAVTAAALITAEDLDVVTDSGNIDIDLDSEALRIIGGDNGITTSASGTDVTVNIDVDDSITVAGLIIDGNKSVTPGDGAMIHVDSSTITDSNTSASGTATSYNHALIENLTLAASNASVTTTDAATLRLGRITAGTNQTLTNNWSLYADGAIRAASLTNTGNYSQTTGDMTLYDATNNGNPTISLGSSATERLKIEAVYESGAQGLDVVKFVTHTAGGSANDARFAFNVDETFIFNILDNGVRIKASGELEMGTGNTILSDSSGTTTLSNIDALDATTEATIESAIDTLSNLTTVGTIGTGVWQGTAINQTYLAGQSGTNTGDITLAGTPDYITISGQEITRNQIDLANDVTGVLPSANLDADTAHISATKQLTHHGISDDIDSDVVYISLLESDAENTSAGNKHLPIIAPAAGKLLKIFVRTTVDLSSETFTWKLYTRTTSQSTNGTVAEIGAQSGSGPTNKTMVTYDFTTGLDSGTNVIAAGDKVQISLQVGDGSTSNSGYFITCLWEWDLS